MKNSPRITVPASLVGLVVVALWSCENDGPTSFDEPLPTELGQFGSLVDSAEYVGSPVTLPPFALDSSGEPPTLPPSVILSNLPAVAQQGTDSLPGSPGTCEAQAFGYGLGSYTAAREPDGTIKWNPADLSNTASAGFLYEVAVHRRLAGPCPHGGKSLVYLKRLIAEGAPSTAQVPYEPICAYLDSIRPTMEWPDEDRLRIGSYSVFNIDPSQGEFIKWLLDAGHAIAFSGPVFEDYGLDPEKWMKDGVFGSNSGNQPPLIPASGHGQLLVGYDDSMGDPSAPGAFLIQNSFGTDWPPGVPGADGRIWWAYRTFLDSQKLAAVAYPRADSVPSQPLGQLQPDFDGPQAFVTGVNHWVAPSQTSDVYLITELQFTEPVTIESITMVEPGTNTKVVQSYELPFSTGYVFTSRADGRQFENGTWQVVMSAEFGGNSGTYTGSFDVGLSVPTTPTAAPIETDTPVHGTNGQAAAVEPDVNTE